MFVDARRTLVEWLRRQLIGPANEGVLRGISPLDRYPTAVLHPVEPDASGIDPASTVSDGADSILRDEPDEGEDAMHSDAESDAGTFARPARRRRYVPPSSVGFSCFVRGHVRLSVTAAAAVYKGTEERGERGQFQAREYTRIELPETTVTWSANVAASETLWGGRGGIDIRARPHREGCIITVTLCNRSELDQNTLPRERTRDRVERSLFESRLACIVESGELVDYPRVDPSLLTDEEQELELQYRKQRIYAVGHGAAADWDVTPGRAARIWSEFMPAAEVPMMTVNIGRDDEVLRLSRLADTPMLDELDQFVCGYADWATEQKRIASELANAAEQAAANRISSRMNVALDRMRACVDMLRNDRVAVESFQLANRAMLDQMRQADRVAGRDADPDDYRWRPFQLAFLLTVMVSTIREEDDFRDVLDLIWFPTGGGKTEAYLGLIAFLVVWRRLKYPDSGGGTVALMRYTLRLLTRQQFERAARMICALELIRRRDPARLGEAPMDIGIWVGGEISPNRYAQARELVEEVQSGKTDARYKLLLECCPWCGTAFDLRHGYHCTDDEFQFHCTEPACEFGTDPRPLPCNVVDDALYDQPPTLLIGTVDKFARLAWEERTGAFFGVDSGSRPPELVIQDELHLITGPLGSVAGLYEAGLDTLLTRRGVRAKYIASTATIRMAHEQVRHLYARELAVFPPPGLSHGDSYFARTDNERPGRLYVGYLAPMLDQQHCMAPLAAAMLAGPQSVFAKDAESDALLDAWWTLVVFHGSLKGVGNSHNAFVTDVREFGRRLTQEVEQHRGTDLVGGAGETGSTPGESDVISERFGNPLVAQLTSRRTAQENAETFGRLARHREEDNSLDAVLATNMVSVGLDVARLALMIVNGQPLTTAEYIQASSRVGRADVPGLVFANYYRSQTRSLSHYETFRPYHESFYRFVEPSSVTPFTHQVRSRALHAALVIAVRHACKRLRSNTSAGHFNRDDPEIKAVVAALERRCEQAAAEPGQGRDTALHLNRRVDQWHDEARRCEQERRQLNYQARNNERNADRLLYTHGESRRGLWATLNSMRNVEGDGVLKVHDWPPR